MGEERQELSAELLCFPWESTGHFGYLVRGGTAMGPEGMQTSVVMANLVGSEKVPGELLWSAQASAAGLGL